MSGSITDFSNNDFRRSFGKILRYSISTLVILLLGCITLFSLKQVSALTEEFSALKDEMPAAVNTEPLELELSRLKQHVEQLEKTIKTTNSVNAETISSLRQSLAALEQRLQDEAIRLDALKTQVQTAERAQRITPSAPAAISAKPSNVKRPVTKRKSVEASPFVLTAVEVRGGIVFAALASTEAKQLAQVSLLETGQSIEGWTLLSVSGQQATFRFADKTRTLTVR